jgi:hypothetical protein
MAGTGIGKRDFLAWIFALRENNMLLHWTCNFKSTLPQNDTQIAE